MANLPSDKRNGILSTVRFAHGFIQNTIDVNNLCLPSIFLALEIDAPRRYAAQDYLPTEKKTEGQEGLGILRSHRLPEMLIRGGG